MFLNIPKGAGSCLLIITILSRTHTARHFGEHSGRELGILGGERSLEMHAPRLLGCTRRVFWVGLLPDPTQIPSKHPAGPPSQNVTISFINLSQIEQFWARPGPTRHNLEGCTRRVFWDARAASSGREPGCSGREPRVPCVESCCKFL